MGRTLRHSGEGCSDSFTAALPSALPRHDLREHVPNLRMPILLIVGRDDCYREDMEWLATHASNATLRVLDGVGHFPFVEAADEFVDLVAAFVTTRGRTRLSC